MLESVVIVTVIIVVIDNLISKAGSQFPAGASNFPHMPVLGPNQSPI
jgi:hypothetical protein